MSILLMAHAMDLEGLTPGQKFVLVVMCNFANDEGENVYPSHDTIARLTSYERRTIVSTVKQLTELDYVTFVKRRGNRQNEYELNVNKIMRMRKICTPETDRCETVAQNPLIIKELKDVKGLKDVKELKDSRNTKFAQQNLQYPMMVALADACNRVLKDNTPVLGRFAKSLLKLGYTPQDVNDFKSWWYKYDWRGKMKQAPYPAQVQELIGLSKSKMQSSLPTQDEIDQAMRELSWEEDSDND